MKKAFWVLLIALVIVSSLLATCVYKNYTRCHGKKAEITKAEIDSAQSAWADGIINIGKTYRDGGNVKQVAEDFLKSMYTFNQNEYIFFRPTLAANEGFRPNFDSALSYFIGKNNFKADSGRVGIVGDDGFAIKPWTKITFTNDQIFKYGSLAIAMGHYVFTDDKGNDTKVEYTFVYKKVGNNLKILVQHSSLPFAATNS